MIYNFILYSVTTHAMFWNSYYSFRLPTMSLKIWFLFLSFIIRLIQGDDYLAKFIRDYFSHYNIHHLVVFACLDTSGALKFVKQVMQLDTVISYNSIQGNIDLKLLLKVNYYHIGVILDHDCPKSDSILEQFSQQLFFNESYSWLLLTTLLSPPMASLRDLPLTVESEMTVATGKFDIFELYDVYNPSYRHGGIINITYKGQWTPENGLKNQLTQFKYNRRQNFYQLPLNFSIVLTREPKPDFETYIGQPINTHLDTMSRFQYALTLQLRDYYNFSINLKSLKSWGFLINGTWTGILGDMHQGTTDVSMSPMQFKVERMPACYFTVNTWNVDIAYIFRHPKKNELQNGFIKPFTYDIWRVSTIVAIIYWIFLYFSARIQLYFQGTKVPEDSLMSIPASESALITVGAVSQQGLSDVPYIIGGRIIYMSLLLWTLLMFQFYSASIVGSLLSKPPRWIITDIDLANSNLDCAMEDIPYNHYSYQHSKNPYGKIVYEKKIAPTKDRPDGSYMSVDDGYKKVRKGGFAFFSDLATGYKIIAQTFTVAEICDLQEVRIVKPAIRTYPITAKNSPFKKLIVYGFRKILEHGLAKRLRSIWHHKKPECPESYSSKPEAMSLKEFRPALFLLFIGMAFSLIILALEYIYRVFFDMIDAEDSQPDSQSEVLSISATKNGHDTIVYSDAVE